MSDKKNEKSTVFGVFGGATVATTALACGCREWRQSLPGHDDAVSFEECDQHRP
jgi:hypothetical protein